MNIVSSDGSILIQHLSACDYDLSSPNSGNKLITDNSPSILLSGLGEFNSKLIADVKISTNPDNKLRIDSTGLLVLQQSLDNSDETVKTSSQDTVAGYLNTKLLAGDNISLTIENTNGNESLRISGDFSHSISHEDTSTVNIFGSGVDGIPLYANVRVSHASDNALVINSDGLYVSVATSSDTYKTKISGGTPDFLERVVDVGTDPLGIVSLSISTFNNKLIITPTIDIGKVCDALRQYGCICMSPSNLNVT